MIYRIAILITVGALTLLNFGFSCHKESRCADRSYRFRSGVTVMPGVESINLGDTLWLESIIPATLQDLTAGQTVDFANAQNLSLVLLVDKFTGGSISSPGTTPAANSFRYSVLQGSVMVNPLADRVREIRYAEVQNN